MLIVVSCLLINIFSRLPGWAESQSAKDDRQPITELVCVPQTSTVSLVDFVWVSPISPEVPCVVRYHFVA